MDNIDALINETQQQQTNNSPRSGERMSPAEFGAMMKQKREEAFALADKTASQCSVDYEKLHKYLEVQSRFPNYSVNNALLVAAQLPEATELHDFAYWQEQDAFINKGAKGITIIEPGKPYTRADGSEGVSYDPKTVFDISQTNGEAKREKPRYEGRALLKALLNHSPVRVEAVDELPNTALKACYFPAEQVIRVTRNTEGPELFRSLAREMAVAMMDGSRQEVLPQAYCAAYVLCRRCGVETTFKPESHKIYTRSSEAQDVKESLGQIRDAARELGQGIEKELTPAKKPRSQGQER